MYTTTIMSNKSWPILWSLLWSLLLYEMGLGHTVYSSELMFIVVHVGIYSYIF